MPPLVRILVVTDDWVKADGKGVVNGGFLRWIDQPANQAVGENSREFHLGEFIRVLTETQWSGFDIEMTKAHRTAAAGNEAQLKADRGADVVGFRFNQPFTVQGAQRSLADYDMILFFPIQPGNPDPAFAAEMEAVAQFMENGGGFFATGDHQNVGSPLAGLIPRVRSMRRWWYPKPGPQGEPVAPTGDQMDPMRIDTTRPGSDNIGQFEDQSDDVPQEIKPIMHFAGYTDRGSYSGERYLPHPLLCSPDGVVRWLPDHMHEGRCEVPDNLGERTFTLAGATVREYPDYTPAGSSPRPLAPVLVAEGEVLPGTTSPALDKKHAGGTAPTQGQTFGVIAAWDGHLVGKGRVVVDSTWHHFFDINLTGDRYLEDDNLGPQHTQKLHGFFVLGPDGQRVPNDAYKMIMWYYRNLVYWLIPPGSSGHIANYWERHA